MKTLFAALVALLVTAPAFAGTAPNYNPPFGMWRIPDNMEGTLPYNLNAIAFDPRKDTPATVFASLNAARAARMHVFMSIMDFANNSGNWMQRYSVWCPNGQCMNLQPYVADGTLLGIHIFEYSGARFEPAGAPTFADIQEVGQVVKTLWPGMPVAIDTAHPCGLVGQNWQGSVDIVLISFYTGRRDDYAAGDSIIDQDAECATRAGLRYTMGPNPFGGSQHGFLPNGVPNFTHYMEYAMTHASGMGTFVWRWWPGGTQTVSNGRQTVPNFWWDQINPGIAASLQEIQCCAAQRTAAACPHAGGP
jgi:hypothetical protein